MRPHLEENLAKAWQIEVFLQPSRPGQGYKEEGEVPYSCMVGMLQPVGHHVVDATTSNRKVTSPSELSSAGALGGG
jgi:hypothetical protein